MRYGDEFSFLVMTDKEIQEKYIEFRCDAMNDRFDDCVFCTENHVTIDQLRSLKTPDVIRAIFNRPVNEDQFFKLLEQLTRLSYDKALNGKIPVKSFEGLINAIAQLLKQRNLSTGKPTEIVKYEDLKKKTPMELHSFIMGELRHGRN